MVSSPQYPLQLANGFSKEKGKNLGHATTGTYYPDESMGGKEQNSSSPPTVFQEQDVSRENAAKYL